MTATVSRPVTVKQRCLQGVKVSKAVLPFLRKNNVPWEIGRKVYQAVVVPTVMFGLNAISMTAQNRRSLRHFERKTVQEWYKACGGATKVSTRKLLKNRTIVKKIKISRITYWGHITRRQGNHLLQAAYKFHLEGPKRKCRPCDTWNQTLDKDLVSMRKERADFEGLLHNKNELKKETNKLYAIMDSSDSEASSGLS